VAVPRGGEYEDFVATELPIFQVDAFAGRRFAGNPAAVVVMPAWLPDDVLLAIAAENNLSETAFVRPEGDGFGLRWFTPTVEVDLCGHATLAAGHVLLTHGWASGPVVEFRAGIGPLTVRREGELLWLDFPSRPPEPVPVSGALSQALGATPAETHAARDLLAVFGSTAEVAALQPDMHALAALDTFAVIVTAPGETCDFVSRFFAPARGVPEDPVTGSAHCTLTPYWSRRLGKHRLDARQISHRGGELVCEDRGERVGIAGRVADYLRGTITV
jgi:PhzF family phenazine biosynthesis protein